MFKLLSLVLINFSVGQYLRPLVFRPYLPHFLQHRPYLGNYGQRIQNLILCTDSNISYEKCIHVVGVARNNSIPFDVECVREESRENCINNVERKISDMVVLSGHDYKVARASGLRPLIFAKESDESLYIAVAPRNITFIDVQQAPIFFDHYNHRAFHAATFFNLRMGHDICSFNNKVSSLSYISIVDTADYVPNSDEILICPERVPNEFANFKLCNVEAELQTAVFVRSDITMEQELAVRKIFETIAQYFNTSSEQFNFFDTFHEQEDVIFKKNTISFDFVPTYRNGVDENIFNDLHCNTDDQSHDHRALL